MRLFNNRRSALQDRISSFFVCLHSLQSGCHVFRLLPRGELHRVGSDRIKIRITFIEGAAHSPHFILFPAQAHVQKWKSIRVHHSKTTNCTVITATSEASFFRFFSWWFPMFDPRTVHGIHGTKTENTHRKYAYVRQCESCDYRLYICHVYCTSAQQQPRYRGPYRGICSLTLSH